MTKIRTICIDTLTAIQNETYMTEKKKIGFDKWRDFGIDIWQLITDLQQRGFHNILIIGEAGVGKSCGMRTLPTKTNIWFNADNKNPVWTGGKEEYGTKVTPIAPYHVIPKTYQEIINHIDGGLQKDMFEEQRYAILTGHIDDYRTGNGETKKRLKVLGNLATKMQLEGRLEVVLYANVKKEGDRIDYIFETQNDGFNTARSPMGLFEPIIPNDYNFIIDKLLNY